MAAIRMALCLALVGVLAGCGPRSDRPRTYPVSGTVTVGGKPLPGATVAFHRLATPNPGIAHGTTDAAGKFELSLFAINDGALPGEHIVTISKVTAAPGVSGPVDLTSPGDDYTKAMAQAAAPPKTPPKSEGIPEVFAAPNTSPLRQTVSETQANSFNIDIPAQP